MIDVIYNRHRAKHHEEVFAFYRPVHVGDGEPRTAQLIGIAFEEEGAWKVQLIQAPDDDILVCHQVVIGTYPSQVDAVLALLCSEDRIAAVLGR